MTALAQFFLYNKLETSFAALQESPRIDPLPEHVPVHVQPVSGAAGRLHNQDQAQQPQAEVPPPSAAPITQYRNMG